VFALEDLTSIGKERWLDRKLKGKLRTWSFYLLKRFIGYKAEELGKSIAFVDPTCTSQWCSRCGWIDKKSRKGSDFHCVRCGFQLHADLNASRIIARLGRSEMSRLPIYQPHAAGDEGDVSGVHSKSPSPAASPESVGNRYSMPQTQGTDHYCESCDGSHPRAPG
jgi:transposase